VKILACLGLAKVGDTRVGPALLGMLKDASQLDTVRAACAYGLGARRVGSAGPALLAALDDNRGETQRLAAWALGQLGETRALGPLLRAYFARAGQSADELVWAIGRVSGAGLAPAPLADLGNYPTRGGKLDTSAVVAALPGSLPHPSPAAKLVVDHATDIAAGLVEALSEHRDVVVSVLTDLDGAPERLALGALTPGTTTDAKTRTALETIAKVIEPKVHGHLGDDDPKVRALAVSVIAKLDGGKLHTADDVLAKAITDPAEQVRASAMLSVAIVAHRRGTVPTALASALVRALGAPAWGDRRVAALALGRLGSGADATALVKAAGDPSSFVREAVAIALGQVGGNVIAALNTLARDDVPQVREAATRSLAQVRHPN
jgi:HEAT repeat protein